MIASKNKLLVLYFLKTSKSLEKSGAKYM